MLLLAVLLFGDWCHVVQLAVSPQESVSVIVAGAGGGEPVVLVPGLLGSACGYRHLIPLLVGAGYRAIVFEPLGVGTSARPERADYSLSAQAERLATVLDTLRVRQAVIIGHDVGAAIARSEEHTSELQSRLHLVCRLLLEKKKKKILKQR